MYYVVMLLILVLDQVSKEIVLLNRDALQHVPVINKVFYLTYVENNGAAYNILTGHQYILIIITGLLIAAGIIYITRRRRTAAPMLMISLSMIVGGGLGNLTDRVTRGYVVDFVDIRIFPVLNLADICVSCGCVLLCIYIIFFDGKKKHDRRGHLQNNS